MDFGICGGGSERGDWDPGPDPGKDALTPAQRSPRSPIARPRGGKIRPAMQKLLPIAILLLLALAGHAEDEGYSRILKRFRELVERNDMDRRADAFPLLDLTNPRSLPPLYEILESDHWFMRGLAAETLGKVTEEGLRAQLRLELLTSEEPLIRDGIALAFALAPEKGDAEALVEALGDGDWRVRRTAAIALAEIVSKESLAALVAALRKEEDPRVAANVARTLALVTGQRFGREAGAWSDWWERNQDSEALGKLDEEVKRRELGELPVETVTVPTSAGGPAGSRPKLEILVLAPLGWTHDVYRPYLDELSRFARVTYIRLPGIRELTGHSGYGSGVPTYPVGKLVKALEELRGELGKNRVLILGEGATGWIAERYAMSYPKTCAGVVILNGFVDVNSYAAALLRLSRSPVPSERWAAQTLMNENSVPHDEAAHRVIARVMLTADLADPSDSLGWLLWKGARDPQGFVSVPAMQFPDRARFEFPVLFFFGGRHRLSGFPEAERIRTHFKQNIIAVMHESRGFPYVTEYEEFYRVMEGFLDHFGLR